MTLDQLLVNDSGTIQQISDADLTEQLLRLGFMIGEHIKVERIAPLKDPIVVASNGNCIGIRKADAQKIEINLA